MNSPTDIFLFSWIVVTILLPFCVHADYDENSVDSDALSKLELGRNIYQKGILPSGKPLTAIGKDGLPFKIQRTACIDCHRRSGLGSSESGILIPPITGEYLFKTSTVKGKKLLDNVGVPRPAYTEETLKTMIHSGVRPNGLQLHEIMPRYKISDQDMGYLIGYLKSLSKVKLDGLRDDEIDFATIITPQMSVDDKQLMLKVMNTYFGDINKDVRQLGHMKSPIHGRYKPYRKWNLHIWELTGDESTWKQQLEERYAETPVFALLGGYGNWQSIHQFCEQNKVLSLFPITDTPGFPTKKYLKEPLSETSKLYLNKKNEKEKKDFYTLYFSQGIKLDAEVVAEKILKFKKKKNIRKILQIYDDDPASATAARVLRNKLWSNNVKNLEELNIAITPNSSIESWRKRILTYAPEILVIWLDKKSSLQMLESYHGSLPVEIYLSSRLLNLYDPTNIAEELPVGIRNNILIVHPFYLKNQNKQHLLRTQMWFRSKKVKFERERIVANTYFALTALTSAIRTSSYNLNREYLMEQFEHMIDNTVYRSIYPHLSLGPDQRYASKGAYLIKVSPELTSEWIVPNN